MDIVYFSASNDSFAIWASTRNILVVQSVDWCFVQKSTSCWLSSVKIHNCGHTMLLLLDILVKYGHWLAAPLALTSVIKRGHQLKLDTKAFFLKLVYPRSCSTLGRLQGYSHRFVLCTSILRLFAIREIKSVKLFASSYRKSIFQSVDFFCCKINEF